MAAFMYWDEKALIENLGSGSVDAAAALLGNGGALQMYGSVMNKDLSARLLFTALWAANSKGFTSLRALPSVAHSAPCKVFFLTHMSSEKTDLSSFAPAGAKP